MSCATRVCSLMAAGGRAWPVEGLIAKLEALRVFSSWAGERPGLGKRRPCCVCICVGIKINAISKVIVMLFTN